MKYSVIVKPNASRNEVVKSGDEIIVKTTKTPSDGEANKDVIKQLSKFLKVPKTQIKIIKGATSKHKIIEI